MKAEPLTKCVPLGGPPGSGPPRTRLPGWRCIRQARETSLWVHAHLLHGKTGAEDLHGPDAPHNLIITDKSINALMFTRVERDAINRIHAQDQVLSYSVTPTHVSNSGDRRFFANAMAIRLDRINSVTRRPEENIFNATIRSNTRRPIPTNCT